MNKFVFSDEVYEALTTGSKPVIALESTIISHGMPYPQNFETAFEVEQIIRDNGKFFINYLILLGCIPATIGILSGIIHIGMSTSQLETFAKIGRKCIKVSRRDFARVVGLGLNGATTVSGTMLCAHAAGIRMFVTGGLGGVHRGAEETWDVSADLTELGRTPVAVVCAGAKSILDIPRTLEYLETQGVMVYGWQTDYFPGFWTPSTGLPIAARVDNADACGEIMRAHIDELQMKNGLVFAIPIPADLAAEAAPIESATLRAVQEAKDQKISGKESTPFLLARINELTQGQSLKSNIALVKNNARIGSLIALADHKHRRSISSIPKHLTPLPRTCPHITVVGGSNVDIIARPDGGNMTVGASSFPGTTTRSVGGVGFNIARNIAGLGGKVSVEMISVVGGDSDGQKIVSLAESKNIKNSHIITLPDHSTATYLAMLDSRGELVTALADMKIHEELTPARLPTTTLANSSLTIIDANLSPQTILAATKYAHVAWCDPVSIPKSTKIIPSLSKLHLIKPNAEELAAIASILLKSHVPVPTSLDAAAALGAKVLKCSGGLRHILISFGSQGAVLVSRPVRSSSTDMDGHISLTHPILKTIKGKGLSIRINSKKIENGSAVFFFLQEQLTSEEIMDVTGAGDSMLAAMAWQVITNKSDLEDLVKLSEAIVVGMCASRVSIMKTGAVSLHDVAKEFNEVAEEVKSKFTNVLKINSKL